MQANGQLEAQGRTSISDSGNRRKCYELSELMLLSSGVRILGAGAELSALEQKDERVNEGRIEMSSGIVPGMFQYPSLPYRPGAFVPKLPWRPLNDAERGLLLEQEMGVSTRKGEWLQLIPTPEAVLERFDNLRVASQTITSNVELQKHVQTSECQEAISFALRYVETFASEEKHELDGAGIFGNAPDMPTTTMANATHLNGLHVDNWSQVPMGMRALSPNRFAINLGLNDRFLLYINLTLHQVARMLGSRGIHYSGGEKSTIGLREKFMAEFPDYPVVRLRIRPGEGYIAPTENIIHDGCTSGQTGYDMRLSVRGHFLPRTGPAESVERY